MTMFIGLRMDEESVEAFHWWLKRCCRSTSGHLTLYNPCPKQFLYLPLVYSGSETLDEDELRSHVAGLINVPVELKRPQMRMLGESGNLSLTFENEWIQERHNFWIKQERRFRRWMPKKRFLPRIPMSHSCRSLDYSWIKTFPLKWILLKEEFSQEFDRKAFLEEVREAQTQ